jgi:hypothetical protein
MTGQEKGYLLIQVTVVFKRFERLSFFDFIKFEPLLLSFSLPIFLAE